MEIIVLADVISLAVISEGKNSCLNYNIAPFGSLPILSCVLGLAAGGRGSDVFAVPISTNILTYL